MTGHDDSTINNVMAIIIIIIIIKRCAPTVRTLLLPPRRRSAASLDGGLETTPEPLPAGAQARRDGGRPAPRGVAGGGCGLGVAEAAGGGAVDAVVAADRSRQPLADHVALDVVERRAGAHRDQGIVQRQRLCNSACCRRDFNRWSQNFSESPHRRVAPKLPLFLEVSGTPPNTWLPGPTEVHTPNGISVVSAVLARF